MHYLILGAGPCGLATAKALSDHGISYEQVEADTDVGGNWLHGVYPTAHIISSRNITQYPDYPMPEDFPDFPSARQMCAYYRSFAEEFDLVANIRFSTKVTTIQPVENNQWEVGFDDGSSRIYLGVLLCNGHHWDPVWPEIPGTFNGDYIHSKYYKDTTQLIGKRTVVIGAGNSACDLASESARLGSKTWLAMRSGIFFIPKSIGGKPSADSPIARWPLWLQRPLIKLMLKLTQGDYQKDYGLKQPTHNLFEKHPTVNDEVLYYIKHGRIQPTENVAAFEGNEVVFTDGKRVAADLVVAATGYRLSYPFLPRGLRRVKGHAAEVVGQAVLPDFRGLYFMGWQQFRGGVGQVFTPLARLTARYIQLQEELDFPLGQFLAARGDTPPTTHLMDPYDLVRFAERRYADFEALAVAARKYARQQPTVNNEVLPAPAVEETILF